MENLKHDFVLRFSQQLAQAFDGDLCHAQQDDLV